MTAPPSGESLPEAYAHCESLARAHDRDRWLSALFAPTAARPHLHALSAFNYEVGRLREIVREPLAGELRLTWWRDALARAEATGHPVATALLDTIVKFNLPMALFENHIAARQFDLYDDPMPSLNDLEGYCGETASSLFQFAALILAEGRETGAA
ncbi:MAG: squalene/phytoene synthase family protein, partial [Roseiarcus sp.]